MNTVIHFNKWEEKRGKLFDKEENDRNQNGKISAEKVDSVFAKRIWSDNQKSAYNKNL